MPFTIIRNDITKLNVDAIVNAANTALQMGGGVCGAIFSAAGVERLQNACDNLAPIKTGDAVITQGFNLPAKYIIHTAGPVYKDGKNGEEELLRACYTNSLDVAKKYDCESVAFPLISSGIYGYPKAEALRIATSAINDFLHDHDMTVSLVVFDKSAFEVSRDLLGEVKSFINEHYIEEHTSKRRQYLDVECMAFESARPSAEQMKSVMLKSIIPAPKYDELQVDEDAIFTDASLIDLVENLDEPFATTLLKLIDATGKKDSEVYRRANIDRRLFSKIRSNETYSPSKPTVLAFAVALELNLDQTEDLMEKAGFALSRSRKFDVIVEYFIQNKKYDIFQINEVLFTYDQPLLGG
jgi:O-acetyl-ADP-ribose deacetylase (regulator of RNase III)